MRRSFARWTRLRSPPESLLTFFCWSEGSCGDYEADRKKRLGAEAERPHRLRYKRLK